ncbi:MAG TPA: helix-turn-helix domain-containing protein [Gemmatimonadales bacterium]|nr:helix-turn-helix domain-containing protein [Gemmatimonadales bacterium]
MRRNGYGQFCPVARGAEVFAERWTPLVIRELLLGDYRFNDLRRGVPLMSPSSRRLRDLERAGVVERVSAPSGRPVYRLTPAGRDLGPVVERLGEWATRGTGSPAGPRDVDPALLMWDIRRRLGSRRPEFPAGRTAIAFELRDAPRGRRYWWLVLEPDPEPPDLCLRDPGYPVDARVSTDLVTMARVWLGEIRAAAAIHTGRMELDAPPALRRTLGRWLTAHPAGENR